MKSTLASVGLAVLASSLLAVPAHGGKGRAAPPATGQGFGRAGISTPTAASAPAAAGQGFGRAGISTPAGASPPSAQGAFPTTRSGTWGQDWAHERREFIRLRNQQRLQERADHLRGIGQRNGNSRLEDTAARFEQRLDAPPPEASGPPSNPYENLEIPPVEPPADEVAPTADPASDRRPSWVERVRTWRPWKR
ncbi:MAG: hypothetical protein GTO03_01610 [Planctomycetales bacterium]|nr:hypothetical protein [Planctomycetales bacterium]